MSEPDYEFSLELVANIAAQLLQGDDYSTAARRSLALIECCNSVLRERAISDAEWIKQQRREIEANSNLQMGDTKDSPAMKWIQEHATDERDRFKTFRAFKDAWLEYAPGTQAMQWHTVDELGDFLQWRAGFRRAADTKRKQIKRAIKNAARKK